GRCAPPSPCSRRTCGSRGSGGTAPLFFGLLGLGLEGGFDGLAGQLAAGRGGEGLGPGEDVGGRGIGGGPRPLAGEEEGLLDEEGFEGGTGAEGALAHGVPPGRGSRRIPTADDNYQKLFMHPRLLSCGRFLLGGVVSLQCRCRARRIATKSGRSAETVRADGESCEDWPSSSGAGGGCPAATPAPIVSAARSSGSPAVPFTRRVSWFGSDSRRASRRCCWRPRRWRTTRRSLKRRAAPSSWK